MIDILRYADDYNLEEILYALAKNEELKYELDLLKKETSKKDIIINNFEEILLNIFENQAELNKNANYIKYKEIKKADKEFDAGYNYYLENQDLKERIKRKDKEIEFLKDEIYELYDFIERHKDVINQPTSSALEFTRKYNYFIRHQVIIDDEEIPF